MDELLELSRTTRRLIGKAIYHFDLITPGDRIGVGLSGGKDSTLLLYALALWRRWSPVKFGLKAFTVDMTKGQWDVRPLKALCQMLDVDYQVIPLPIVELVERREERSPCSFCANLRRGHLNSVAVSQGCNKLALGHNLDDTAETALMNLFHGGRFRAYQPKLYHDRANITLIRPLVYLTEDRIRAENKRLNLEQYYLDYVCPFSKETERSRTKKLVAELMVRFPTLRQNIQHALETLDGEDQWKKTSVLRRDDNLGPTGNERRKEAQEQPTKD